MAILVGVVANSASASSAPPVSAQAVVKCLRAAGWQAHLTTQQGRAVIVASSAGVNFAIAVKPVEGRVAWTGYGRPSSAQERTLMRCLRPAVR